MKTFVKVLVCCLFIGSLCGCQLTKNPATTSSVSKEDAESLSHTVEDVYSVASEETSSAVSKIDNSINSVASVESSNSPSSVYSSGSKNTATASTILSSSQSSVITSSQNDSSTSLDATNSNQSTICPPSAPMYDFNGEDADVRFFEWIKESRYEENIYDRNNREDEFLKWAHTKKEILMPKVDDIFSVDYVKVEHNGKILYTFKYKSKKENNEVLYSTIYPLTDEDKDTNSLIKLIKKYDYHHPSEKAAKYKKIEGKCKWGTYYTRAPSHYNAWFRCGDYLVEFSCGKKFNNEYFKLIDLEFKEFGDRFYNEQDFVNWVKNNRSTYENDDFGWVFLYYSNERPGMILPRIKSDKFRLKEVYPFYKVIGHSMNVDWHEGGYKAVYISDKPVNGIESLEFEFYPSRSDKPIPYYKDVPLGDGTYMIEENHDNYEFVHSKVDKCRFGLYVLDKIPSTEAYFSHWNEASGRYNIIYTVNTNKSSDKFEEEYFDLFDFEYISFE